MTQQSHVDPSAEQIDQANSGIRYVMYTVLRASSRLPQDRSGLIAEAREFLVAVEQSGVVVRGLFDVSGFRADADLMVWWHAETAEQLQAAYHALLRTQLGAHLEPVWSTVGLHRPAEFNRSHIPNFLADPQTRRYLCVYPFVRSYEWYSLPAEDRSRMLREHGLAAKDYPDVRANTVSSFALGDYEWLLAFEADELHRIVDVMRELRSVEARLHVREEVPFYTGPAVTVDDFIEQLP
ncbi:hydrogen peroxide-dependent heme synthase [Dermacoccaceae bacterium W4C1]